MNIDAADHARLRQLAERLLRGERRDHTLAPTELVHEAWLRLARGAGDPTGDGSAPDSLLAARVMRQLLVDHARRRSAAKRDAGRRITDGGALLDAQVERRDRFVVELDEALADLAEQDPELARIVELRFFGGLDVDETAALLAISPRTVKRRWQLARAWLQQAIGDDDDGDARRGGGR